MIKKIDLNHWTKVETPEELEGYNSLIIVPNKLVDGTQLPPLYFRRGDPKIPEIIDTTDAIWEKNCRISKLGNESEYAHRVDWWFDNALLDPDYKDIVNQTFNRNGFDIKMSWEKARAWMKRMSPDSRKTYIHKFVWNWLSKGMSMQLDRLARQRSNQ